MKNMYKFWAIITVVVVMMSILLAACSGDKPTNMVNNSENISRFVILEKVGDDNNYDVIYVDTRTGVEYFVHCEYDSGHSERAMWGTALWNADGTPMIAPGY